MADQTDFNELKHIHISFDVFRDEVGYAYPGRKIEKQPRREDYSAHAEELLAQLAAALGEMPEAGHDDHLPIEGLKPGKIVEVGTMPPPTPQTKAVKIPAGLEFPTQDVAVLRSERRSDRAESALLFIPDEARDFLMNRIRDYGKDPGNQPRQHIDRFELVETIQKAKARDLFIGNEDFYSAETLWWELWVRKSKVGVSSVLAAAQKTGLEVHQDHLEFPDTTVIFVHGSAVSVAGFAERVLGAVTEIRRSTGTIDVFLERNGEGAMPEDWIADLASRVTPPPADANAVCTLDTGISGGHPLIAPALHGAWAYDDEWGADDHYHEDGGHGTPLAGLALYGDLETLMNGMLPVELTHAVESMKLLPPSGFPDTDPPNFGVVTEGAVAKVETERPNVLRTYCLANSTDKFPPDRPSSWSGALDQIASGSMPGDKSDGVSAAESPKRMTVVAAGNNTCGNLKDVKKLMSLEDPSQSWNALTIGGITQKETLPPNAAGLKPVVPANHRSPFSTGSQCLANDLTPIKPEVLFEAGNMSVDAYGICTSHPSLSLLAPGYEVQREPLVPFYATSAAAGMAGNFFGGLQSALPDHWPETHRALIVDSASWPEPIRKHFIGRGAHWKTGSKSQKQHALREFGYGLPDLQRAKFSARNDVTLVAQAQIQPFAPSKAGGPPVFNEMHFYNLPWPETALEEIGNDTVMMKVTLSYFIEPNLSGKAATHPETYRSFGLRFAMKKRLDTKDQFLRRVSGHQEKGTPPPQQEADRWLLGPNAIKAGSLHCDLWRGKAIELSLHNAIAVYPVTGWWKTHAGQNRYNDKGRYALVISISASEHSVDLYNEISSIVEAEKAKVVV